MRHRSRGSDGRTPEISGQVHDQTSESRPLGSIRDAAGRYLPELIYGANDGIVTTFAIVSGVVGANLATPVVLILGVASLLADAFSMAASNYLSERSRPGPTVPRVRATRHASATFIGFMLAGILPLTAYIIPMAESMRFGVAAAITLITLFGIGAARSLAAERIQWFRGGLEMLLIGTAAAVVAYGLGAGISQWVGRQTPV